MKYTEKEQRFYDALVARKARAHALDPATLAEVERKLSAKLVEPGLAKSQFGGLSLAIAIVQQMSA